MHLFRRDYIPGTTLRGLMATSYLKRLCSGPKIGACDDCPLKSCTFRTLFLSNVHGLGAYFHPTPLPKADVSRQACVAINRISRTAQQAMLFEYEHLGLPIGKSVELQASVATALEKDSEGALDELTKVIMGLKYESLGGRRSWGWGLVMDSELLGVEEIETEVISPKNNQRFDMRIRSPLPIVKGDVGASIEEALRSVAKAYGLMVGEVLVRMKKYTLGYIAGWDMKTGKARGPLPAITDGVITLECNLVRPLGAILGIAKYTGLTVDGEWYTKTGYGLIESV